VVAATDISHEKRRRALERTFFHDLMNTALGLMFVAKKLAETPPEKAEEATARLQDVVNRLLEEIREQRDLAAAENDDLAARPASISTRPFLEGLMRLYRQLADRRGCRFVMADETQEAVLKSDSTLLARVLGNMMKNALEASGPGQTVTVGCERADARVEFWVHNEGAMPREVQHRVFQRSFSTKGIGRGLGTYSMKLLGEGYLKGTVTFTSSPEKGTTFTASFPPAIDDK
jgi:signal transduction histidine kinase